MNQASSLTTCPGCAKDLSSPARFCCHCGRRLERRQLLISPQKIAIVVVTVGAISWGVFTLNERVIGRAPTNQMHSHVQTEIPADQAGRQALAIKLWDELRSSEAPSQTTALQLIEVLGAILDSDSQDTDALLMMANVAFNQRVFEKSVEYYERYLKILPQDSEARASYASALTFLGRAEEAIKELDTVLAKNSTNFQALAYKTIALTQVGKADEAKTLGQQALSNAPSPDARARFATFMQSLDVFDEMPSEKPTPASNPLVNFIETHGVAGKKLVRHELKAADSSIAFFMRAFPMESIPPGMKDTFFAKIKAYAADSQIKKVVFVDVDSNREMVSLDVP